MATATDPVTLEDARDPAIFGGKAVQLGALRRAGLPAPEGIALAWPLVEEFVSGDEDAERRILASVAALGGPLAVRSSGVGEDSAQASFAGVHESYLNVTGEEALLRAIRDVHASGASDAAIAYRRRHGQSAHARVGVVVQRFLLADVSGVLFTRHPVTGADERVIESSWGLGEAIVGGLVTPDHDRVARDGTILERRSGDKDLEIVPQPGGGVAESEIEGEWVSAPCLGEAELRELLAMATRCEELELVEGPLDVEWCFAGGELRILQIRPMTA